jgi:hypothetical protein
MRGEAWHAALARRSGARTLTHGLQTRAQFRTHKVIYRRYAGLFFSMCVDTTGACGGSARRAAPHAAVTAATHAPVGALTENELACLEAIHLFVEILDTYFSHVCELDLVWHFHKARPRPAACLVSTLCAVSALTFCVVGARASRCT